MATRKELEAVIRLAGAVDPSLQKSLTSATKQFSGMKIGMAAVGTAAVAATAAIVKFGVDSVKSAAAFEKQMANVATLLDGTSEQINSRISELSDDVIQVSNNTGVATSELSDGLYQIISAVGDSEDAIKQMELAAKAAKAGGAETTDAINLLTAVTKGYNDTSGEAFQKASDLSFMTVKLGQTSFPELAASMGKTVPLAAALGVAQEDLYGSYAALTGVTGSTAEVSTQMKAVLSGLMSPTDGMTKALESLGYANANAAIETLGFQGMLEALGDACDGDNMKMAKLFSSVEAQTAILALGGSQAQDFANKTAAMYEATGATDRAFAAQTDTLEYTIECIKNLGKNFMTTIGRKILPTVKSVAEKSLPVVVNMLDKIEPIITDLYAALSPVVEVFGDMITSILPKMDGYLLTLKDAWVGTFQKMGPILENLATNLFPVFQNVFGQVCDLFADIYPVIADFVAQLFPILGEVIIALMPIIQTLTTALSPIFDMIRQLAASLFPALINIMNALLPIIQLSAQVITGYLASALTWIMPIIQNIVNAFAGLCDFISNIFTGNWSAAWTNIVTIFGNIFSAVTGLAAAPVNSIISLVNGVISAVNGMGFVIPEWVPVLGGKAFELNIPQLPLFASGGFTNGASIAGEEAMEAVISFDPAYHNENLSYWAKAGRMLGVDDGYIDNIVGDSYGGDEINVTFAPQITIHGEGKKEDIIEAIREAEPEFMDLLEELLERRGARRYGYGI